MELPPNLRGLLYFSVSPGVGGCRNWHCSPWLLPPPPITRDPLYLPCTHRWSSFPSPGQFLYISVGSVCVCVFLHRWNSSAHSAKLRRFQDFSRPPDLLFCAISRPKMLVLFNESLNFLSRKQRDHPFQNGTVQAPEAAANEQSSGSPIILRLVQMASKCFSPFHPWCSVR